MPKIDYLTVSLAKNKSKFYLTTYDVLCEFGSILPDLYKQTCKDAICSNGTTQRVTQYGITVSKQYGTASQRGWKYNVQLSSAFWKAIDYDYNSVKNILDTFTAYRISRLDLAKDVCVPIKQWQKYYKSAFKRKECTLNGKEDARTVYYGSRKSQFYTRVYNKTAENPLNYPAPENKVIIRFEIEIHRVRGDLVLDYAFNEDFTNRIFQQRLNIIAKKDNSNFIEKYFKPDFMITRIRTVRPTLGNIEKSVEYVFDAYKPYILAGLKSEAFINKYKDLKELPKKAQKILTVLNERERKE